MAPHHVSSCSSCARPRIVIQIRRAKLQPRPNASIVHSWPHRYQSIVRSKHDDKLETAEEAGTSQTEGTTTPVTKAPPGGPDHEMQGPKGMGGSKLPPRPQDKDKPKGLQPFQRPSPLSVFASYGAYTGLIGTLAVASAWAADVNLAAMFRWNPSDLELAFLLVAPLQLFDLALMVPEYSSWSLPKIDDQEIKSPVQGKERGTPGMSVDEEGKLVPSNTVPASNWGKKKSLQRVFKDAMHLAQGHYTANNPTGSISPGLELVAAMLNSLATEMLYRGVVITLLGAWLTDRYYEAGADDILTLPLPMMNVSLPTPEAGSWSAAIVIVLISLGLAARKVLQPQRRMAVLLDLRQSANPKESATPRPTPTLPPPSFNDTLSLTAIIQGGRNVSQTLILNLIFVMTGGNLAATYGASVANHLAFSALQRYSMERMRLRSSALAKELQELNKKLRDIKQRQQEKKQLMAKEALESSPVSTSVASTTSIASSPPVASSTPVALSNSIHLSSPLSSSLMDDKKRSDEVENVREALGDRSREEWLRTENQYQHGGDSSSMQVSEGEHLMTSAVTSATVTVNAAVTSASAANALVQVSAAGAGVLGEANPPPHPDQLTRALIALDQLLPPEPTKTKKG